MYFVTSPHPLDFWGRNIIENEHIFFAITAEQIQEY